MLQRSSSSNYIVRNDVRKGDKQVDNDKSRLLVISNRLPVTIKKDPSSGEWSSSMSSGGLVAALSGLEAKSFLWIGWVGCEVEEQDQETVKDMLLKKYNCIPVFLSEKIADQHYNGFSNGVLWPLFHYLPGDIDYDEDIWKAYQQANLQFADVVQATYTPGDLVWVHDYHLMLLPAILRQMQPAAKMGFFLHIPFPSSEIFRVLPCRKELLRGVLDCNLLGFHTYDYARHFLKACTRILGLETAPNGVHHKDRFVPVGIFPVGIDPDKFLKTMDTPEVQKRISELQTTFEGKRVLIGVDRLDYIKGMPQKLLGMERLFQKYPQWQGQVVLIQVAVPSRQDVEEYQRLKREVEGLVGRINGTYGNLGYSPVHYMFKSVDMNELCALYGISDACVITSIRDGMNLVCQEYVCCQRQRHGALILSEFAGSAQSLSGSIMVNPWNTEELADAFHQALSMSSQERLEKHQQLYKYVAKHTAAYWGLSFVNELKRASAHENDILRTPRLERASAIEGFKATKRRLIVLAYDGTLVPYSAIPILCRPPPRLQAILKALASDPSNSIYIVSGRDRRTLDSWLSALPVGVVAEHGCFMRLPGQGPEAWQQMVPEVDSSWKDTVRPMLQHFQARTPGSFFEEKEMHLTWHFRNADAVFGALQARELHMNLDNLPVDVVMGSKNITVRSYAANVAGVVKKVFQDMSPPDLDLVLMMGEFNNLISCADFPQVREECFFTCSVGKRTKFEKAYLNDTAEVTELLDALARETGTPPSPVQTQIHAAAHNKVQPNAYADPVK